MNEANKAEIRQRLGNIVQLRDLLFGDQLDAYNAKLEQYQQRLNALEESLEESQLATANNLLQLEKKIFNRLNLVANTLDKKINQHNLETQNKHQELREEFAVISQYSHKNIDFLHRNLASTNSLKTEITQLKSDCARDLALFKQELASKLENQLAELTTDRISRTDLAEVLGELALKLKESDED